MILNIIFQFGRFEAGDSSFCMDLLVSIVGAIVGIGGAYWIYHLSIKSIRKDRLTYVVSLLESIIPNAKQQAAYCQTQSDKMKENPLHIPHLQLEANSDLKRLADKVEQEGVYHAFLNKYGRKRETYKRFKNIYGAIDFLNYAMDDLISFNLKTNDAIWARKKEYAAIFTKIKEKIELIVIDRDITANYPVLIAALNAALNNFNANNHGGENVIHSYNSLVVPVRNHIAHNGPVIPQNTELMQLLNDAQNNYIGIKMAAERAAEDFLDYKGYFDKGSAQLESETTQLRKDYSIK